MGISELLQKGFQISKVSVGGISFLIISEKNFFAEETFAAGIIIFCGEKLLRFTNITIFCGNKLLRLERKPQKPQNFLPQTLSSSKVTKIFYGVIITAIITSSQI